MAFGDFPEDHPRMMPESPPPTKFTVDIFGIEGALSYRHVKEIRDEDTFFRVIFVSGGYVLLNKKSVHRIVTLIQDKGPPS